MSQKENLSYNDEIQKVTGPLMASGYQKNGTQEAMNGMYVVSVDTSHADDVVRIDDKVAPLQSRDFKGGKLVMEDTQKYVLENHPADSRIKISEDGVVQTLSGRMGTGGNNTPMVMEEKPIQKKYMESF